MREIKRDDNISKTAYVARSMRPEDWGWLFFMSDRISSIFLQYSVWYLDTSVQKFTSVTLATPSHFNRPGNCWYIPIGIQQCNLDPAGKGVWFWKVYIFELNNGSLLSSYQVLADNRQFPNSFPLYYRNSFGGFDHILLKGVIELNGAEIDKKEYEQQRSNVQWHVRNGPNPHYHSEMRFKYKGNTGFIDMKTKLALADLFNSTFCAVRVSGALVPVRISSGKMEPSINNDGLFDCSIEFETAAKFETMPRRMISDLINP